MTAAQRFNFIGTGGKAALAAAPNPFGGAIGPWRRYYGDTGVDDERNPNHPANYMARGDLPAAVNTAIVLSKPLLLTGAPGTGKSQLAERIAWEFNLGPVLRFEAQSLSEAADLFYRFDLVGHLAAVEMLKAASRRDSSGTLAAQVPAESDATAPERFIKLGPLGEAIVRSDPRTYRLPFNAVFGRSESADTAAPRPSVVLIDEIDKASRDFPNDLLNGIERLEFRIRELGLDTMRVDPAHRPIVIITSNSERELPHPFLRRCAFFHIEDPNEEQLRQIVARRFFSDGGQGTAGGAGLPPLYHDVVEKFWAFREQFEDSLQYAPGTSELIDWTGALRSRAANAEGDLQDPHNSRLARETASAVCKHRDDQAAFHSFLIGLSPA